ncbi:MAG: hypothetical protein A2157_03630 [Deltaproteobacteria bacterium RBG_16_47_11]|nr:MAG: hypothetical protein A2157_03630 [Deltaproteobacteria bacterium RBG_16_47_11]
MQHLGQRKANQATWDFRAAEIHRARNKTELRKYLKEMREQIWRGIPTGVHGINHSPTNTFYLKICLDLKKQ